MCMVRPQGPGTSRQSWKCRVGGVEMGSTEDTTVSDDHDRNDRSTPTVGRVGGLRPCPMGQFSRRSGDRPRGVRGPGRIAQHRAFFSIAEFHHRASPAPQRDSPVGKTHRIGLRSIASRGEVAGLRHRGGFDQTTEVISRSRNQRGRVDSPTSKRCRT